MLLEDKKEAHDSTESEVSVGNLNEPRSERIDDYPIDVAVKGTALCLKNKGDDVYR